MNFGDPFLKLRLFFFKGFQFFSLLVYKAFHFLGFVALSLRHKHTYLLAHLVAVCTQIVRAVVCGAFFAVKRDDLVYKRQLFIFKFLFDVFFNYFRIFTNKFNVQHFILLRQTVISLQYNTTALSCQI